MSLSPQMARAERRGARPFEPPREQHAETLMGEPSLERIANEVMPLSAREGLDQDFVGAWDHRDIGLEPQPV
jgi:hypothetical protein